uniref:BTB domain-containing protein n=2 Tax=Amphimedon queenslandica TaxID=400682 RepID=A0A1X7V0A8_AMPQE
MDDSDSKVAPSLSPVLSTESGSTRENNTKRLTDKFIVQAKNYVETGSERKALEGTLSFLKLKSLRHNDARKALHANAGLVEGLQSLLVSGGAAGEEGDGVKALAWSILANLCAIDKRIQEKVINIALAEIWDSLDEASDCNEEEHPIVKKSKRKKNEAKKKLSDQEKPSNSNNDLPTGTYHKDTEPPSKKLSRTISDEESTSSLYYLSPPYNMEDSGGGRGSFSPTRETDLAHSPLFEKLSPLLNINEDEASSYSATSPLSKGTFSPSCQAALEANNTLSSPVPTNFIDSLLSPTSCSPVAPSKTIKRSSSHEIGSNHSSSPHSKVLLLLSRVSHLHDCQPILASVDVLSVIMDYYLTMNLKDGHCFKVLSRLFSNPHCFQDCLVTLAPSMLFHHMIMTDDNGGVTNAQCNATSYDRRIATSNTQSTSYQRAMGYPSPPIGDLSNMRLSEKVQHRGSSSTFQTAAPGNQPLLLGDQSPVGVGQSVKDLCVQLLEKLSRVAESPYGQGVIAHMLLRGDERDVMAGSLGLILLEKSHSICHKMLTEYGGLHNLLCLSKGQLLTTQCSCSQNTSTIEDTELKELTPSPPLPSSKVSDQETLTQLMAIDTLLYLGSQYRKCPSRKRRHSAIERRSSATLPLPIKAGTISPPPLSSPLCLYRDFDHWPFDTCIILDDGTMFPVHRRVLVESSEVFSVMLSGCYKESTDSSVSLHSVCPSSFRSLVHHAYGCGSHCWGRVSEKEAIDEHYDDEVIDEIVASIKEKEGQERGKHLLRVLISANQFFMCSLLTAAQESFMLYLSPKNVTPLFLFSQLHQCSLLSDATVQLLVGRGPGFCQSESFLRLVRSIECDEFLSTITTVFHQK